jgi:hypothetical protein
MLEAVDSRRVAIRKRYLQSVIAHGLRALRCYARLEHRQLNGRDGRGSHASFLIALIVAQRARTQITQIRKRVVARVPVRPGDIHSLPSRDAYLYVGWFFADILRYWHPLNSNRDRRCASETDSRGRAESDCRAGRSGDDRGTRRCAGRARG